MAYTTIDDPSAHFQVSLWTGNSVDDRSIDQDGNSTFQPDMVWIKGRSHTHQWYVYDSTRGVNNQLLLIDSATQTTVANRLQAFESDGFQLGTSSEINYNTSTYVGFQWKANSGTTSSNATGDITSTVQANTTAGFSIVKYTGTGNDNDSIGHSLGVAPEMIIIKKYTQTDDWMVFHHKLTAGYEIKLNTTAAQADDASNATWGDNHPTNISSTVFEVGYAGDANACGADHIAYCFAPIQGYSKFGIYEGNADADGTFVYLGFKPKMIILKNIDAVQNWYIFDSVRDALNPITNPLAPNTTGTEDTASCDFLSNGFKMRHTDSAWNGANTYIYMSWAEQPFVTSGGVPCTAR